MITIDRCVCASRSFACLLDEARRDGLSLEGLCDRSGASRGCEMCRPYLRRAFRTGQTVFHQIIVDRLESEAG